MNTGMVSAIVGVIIIVGVGLFVYMQTVAPAAAPGTDTMMPAPSPLPTATTSPDAATTTSGATTPKPTGGPTPSPTPSTSSGSYTMAEVGKHNTAQSCWAAIRGAVYDLTSWIPNHPGGPDKILQLCGKDGTAKFEGQHGGSALQERTLAGFKIGVVK